MSNFNRSKIGNNQLNSQLTTYNISNVPVVDQYGRHIGYNRIPIDPTLRQKTTLQYSSTAPSNIWYSGRRFDDSPTPTILIAILILVIGLLVIAISWAIWRLYIDHIRRQNQDS